MVIASLASMVLASLVALQQKKLKRFLAYSSIGHVGYMLVGFSTGTIEGGTVIVAVCHLVCGTGAKCVDLCSFDREAKEDVRYSSRIYPRCLASILF